MNQKKPPKISIIILNYNSGNLLLDCVESVLSSHYENLQVIIVDNVSSDNSHKLCKEKFPSIILIENKKNLGYCEGNNIGMRHADGEYFVILNPDTIVEPNWLNEFLKAYDQVGPGLFQGKNVAIDNDKILRSTGNMIQLFGFGSSRDKGKMDTGEKNRIEEINYASGTCLFTSKSIIEKIGMFDPFLFLYHDDLELGWRASSLNIKSYFVPSVKIRHVSSYTLKWSSKKFFWLERNRKYCIKIHYSNSTRKKISMQLFLVDVLVFFIYLSKGMLKAKIQADLDLFKNRKIINKKYFELEKQKSISDLSLIKNFSNTIFIPSEISSSLSTKIINRLLSILTNQAKRNLYSN